MPIVLIPLALYLLYKLENWVFKRFWDRNLKVRLDFEKRAVVEGQDTALTEVITNRNFIPLHILQVSFQTDVGLDFEESANVSVSDRVNVTDVFSLRFYSRITRHLPVKCRKRGYYSILHTSVNASNYFSQDINYAVRKQQTSLYVYPQRIPAGKMEPLFKELMGEVVTKRFLYEDTFTFRGIREYVPTDPVSSINWKATARDGQAKVNIHDYTSSPSVVIVLNVEEPQILYETELIEDCIRLTVSMASGLIDAGIPVALLSNGKDKVTGETVRLFAGASKDHLESFLRALARIDLSKKSDDIEELVAGSLKSRDSEKQTFVFISTSKREKAIGAAERICNEKGRLMWICPLTKDMDAEAPLDRRVDFRVFIHD
jgi:uncharacterized protein (DUF58 family)